nr:DNA (cytosine-5)-methyltransferase 1B-like [Ipomoea batatas]
MFSASQCSWQETKCGAIIKALLAFAAPDGAKIKATTYHPSPIRLSTEWVASQFIDGNAHGRQHLVQAKKFAEFVGNKKLAVDIKIGIWEYGKWEILNKQGLGNRHCHSCKAIKSQEEKNTFWYSESSINFTYEGIHNEALDFLYISPSNFEES